MGSYWRATWLAYGMGDDIRTLANTDSGIVLVCKILACLPLDILSGLGMSTAVPHDVVRHLTVLAVIGGAIHAPVASPTCPAICL